MPTGTGGTGEAVAALGAVIRRMRRRMDLSVEQLAERASVATGSWAGSSGAAATRR